MSDAARSPWAAPSSALLDRIDAALPSQAPLSVDEAELETLQDLAHGALTNNLLRRRLLATLLQSAISLPPAHPFASEAVRLCWQVGSSNSGSAVDVRLPAREPIATVPGRPTTGVLLLGFAGSSMGMLSPYIQAWQELWPTWRVVTTMLSGVSGARAEAARAAQIRAVEEGLDGCDRLVVHAMSNGGGHAWAHILKTLGAPLASRVAAIAFDCGACAMDDYPPAALSKVLKQTMQAAALINRIEWRPPPTKPHERQLGALVADAVGVALELSAQGKLALFPEEDICPWLATHDPPVPTRLLTSAEDTVLPEAGVRAFAELLRRTQPARPVTTTTLRGPHVRLLLTCEDEYKAELAALAREAGLEDANLPAAPSASPGPAPSVSAGPGPASLGRDETAGLTEAASTMSIASMSIAEMAAANARASAHFSAAHQRPEPAAAPDTPAEEDPKFEKLLRRLDRLSMGKGAPLGTKEVINLRVAAATTLTDSTRRRRLVTALLQIAVDVGPRASASGEGRPLVDIALTTLMRLAASCDGTEVRARSGGKVGVLILGFGGASMAQLQEVDEIYAGQWPGWASVMTTSTGWASEVAADGEAAIATCAAEAEAAAAALEAQRRAVVDGLGGCEQILVHVMSNNGLTLWRGLLADADAAASLAPRVRGVVYDCGPALEEDMPAEFAIQVLIKSIFAASVALGLDVQPREPTGSLSSNLARAVAAYGVKSDGSRVTVPVGPPRAALDAMALKEPSVPTLFLASSDDVVVPELGVRNYVAALRQRQPDREMSIEVLSGAHCQLHTAARSQYVAELGALVERAGMAA